MGGMPSSCPSFRTAAAVRLQLPHEQRHQAVELRALSGHARELPVSRGQACPGGRDGSVHVERRRGVVCRRRRTAPAAARIAAATAGDGSPPLLQLPDSREGV